MRTISFNSTALQVTYQYYFQVTNAKIGTEKVSINCLVSHSTGRTELGFQATLTSELQQ